MIVNSPLAYVRCQGGMTVVLNEGETVPDDALPEHLDTLVSMGVVGHQPYPEEGSGLAGVQVATAKPAQDASSGPAETQEATAKPAAVAATPRPPSGKAPRGTAG